MKKISVKDLLGGPDGSKRYAASILFEPASNGLTVKVDTRTGTESTVYTGTEKEIADKLSTDFGAVVVE